MWIYEGVFISLGICDNCLRIFFFNPQHPPLIAVSLHLPCFLMWGRCQRFQRGNGIKGIERECHTFRGSRDISGVREGERPRVRVTVERQGGRTKYHREQ